MELNIPYKVIKSHEQYFEYCHLLHDLLEIENKTEAHEDVIDLLTALIEIYDREQDPDEENFDPVQNLKFVMDMNNMKAADLAKELAVSKSLISDILHYRRGFSKEFIRKLGQRFTFRQELWNKPYKLQSSPKSTIKK